MTTEQKAKAYDEALKVANNELRACGTFDCDCARQIFRLFPELKENKEPDDEKVRKGLIELVKQSSEILEKKNQEQMIAWIEKQGEHANFRNKIQIGDKITRNRDGYLVNLSQLNRVAKVEEKQGEQKLTEPKFKVGDKVIGIISGMQYYITKVCDNHYCTESGCIIMFDAQDNFELVEQQLKKIEQKPADKVKPKFHKGDWVMHNDNSCICQIKSIRDDEYCLWPLDSKIEGYLKIIDIDNEYHLWTIKNAKDGDFLICGEDKLPFIFKGLLDKLHPDCPVAYCGICEDGIIGISKGDGWWTGEEVFPATKEQREQLLKAIADAGYEWDAEKKELMKIKQKPTDEEMKTLLQTEYEKGRADAIAEMQKSWSEEDEKQLNDIMWIIEAYRKNGFNETHIQIADNSENWLKSLKDRVQPKQECSEEDENNIIFLTAIIEECFKDKEEITLCGDTVCAHFTKEDVIERLKSLRPQNRWKPSDRDIKLLRELSDGKICPDNYRTRLYEIINNLKFL